MELCFLHIAITHLILQITVQYAEQAYQFCLLGGHAISFDAMRIQCHCRIILDSGVFLALNAIMRFKGIILNENDPH